MSPVFFLIILALFALGKVMKLDRWSERSRSGSRQQSTIKEIYQQLCEAVLRIRAAVPGIAKRSSRSLWKQVIARWAGGDHDCQRIEPNRICLSRTKYWSCLEPVGWAPHRLSDIRKPIRFESPSPHLDASCVIYSRPTLSAAYITATMALTNSTSISHVVIVFHLLPC